MKDIKIELKIYKVYKVCEQCNKGFIVGTGKGISQISTSWENKCNKCGEISWHSCTYPTREEYPVYSFMDNIRSLIHKLFFKQND